MQIQVNPLGGDDLKPRLSLVCRAEKHNAYQVFARSENGDLVWTSKRAKTDRMLCGYAGRRL